MPGWELFDETETKSVNEVMSAGVLMRYGFTGALPVMGNNYRISVSIVPNSGGRGSFRTPTDRPPDGNALTPKNGPII